MLKLMLIISLFVVFIDARPQLPPKHLKNPTIIEHDGLVNVDVVRSAPASVIRKTARNYVPNEYEKEQNKNAKYQFSSDVEDHISDLTQQRTETRDGLAVRGSYSYSDGYYKRTVHYEADEKGYRVTGQEAIPLAGPQVDLHGTASVSNAAHGTHVAYKVQSVPIPGPVAKIIN